MKINRTHINFLLFPYYETDKDKILKTVDTINTSQNGKIKVIYYYRNSMFGHNVDTCEISNLEEEYKELVDRINIFKNHPSIIAWFINDEMPECFNEYIRNKTLTMHELDPNHPTVSTENKRKHSQSFLKTTDVYGVVCYPIANNDSEDINCYYRHNLAYNDIKKSKPMLPVAQIFDWVGVFK